MMPTVQPRWTKPLATRSWAKQEATSRARRGAAAVGEAVDEDAGAAMAARRRLTRRTRATRRPNAARMTAATGETRSEPVLPDDGDRLLERRSPHRPRVREDRRRRDCAISSAAR